MSACTVTANLIALLNSLIDELSSDNTELTIRLHDQVFIIRSNNSSFIHALTLYFPESIQIKTPNTSQQSQSPLPIKLYAIDNHQLQTVGTNWQDWPRPANKTGRKETFHDFHYLGHSNRFVFKLKTGMLFWQHSHSLPLVAVGEIEKNQNQIINFILTQSLNHHLRQNWLLGHCSALRWQNKTLAFAGLSGGGKSTLMLHFMNQHQRFISNDRIVIKLQGQTQTLIKGIPKHPRINPGTIINNSALSSLVSEQQKSEFQAMPTECLRQLEQKFDANVESLYGKNCFLEQSQLDAMVVLNWSADSETPTQVNITSLHASPRLVNAIIKSAGPFYANSDGQFLTPKSADEAPLNPQPYLSMLSDVICLEVTGKIDFDAAKTQVASILNKLNPSESIKD